MKNIFVVNMKKGICLNENYGIWGFVGYDYFVLYRWVILWKVKGVCIR